MYDVIDAYLFRNRSYDLTTRSGLTTDALVHLNSSTEQTTATGRPCFLMTSGSSRASLTILPNWFLASFAEKFFIRSLKAILSTLSTSLALYARGGSKRPDLHEFCVFGLMQ